MNKALGEKNICLHCGRCCRIMHSRMDYKELSLLAEMGDKASANFLKLFIPYKSLQEVLDIDANYANKIIEFNKKKYGQDAETYFYYCKYLNENNTCKVYRARPNICKEYPKSAFTIIPENCAYEGYLFEATEEIKKDIRKIKEELMEIHLIKKNSKNVSELTKYENIEKKYIMLIDKYRIYGSENW